MYVSRPLVHPVEAPPTTDVAAQNALRMRMKDVQGMPGTPDGLALRLCQLRFAESGTPGGSPCVSASSASPCLAPPVGSSCVSSSSTSSQSFSLSWPPPSIFPPSPPSATLLLLLACNVCGVCQWRLLICMLFWWGGVCIIARLCVSSPLEMGSHPLLHLLPHVLLLESLSSLPMILTNVVLTIVKGLRLPQLWLLSVGLLCHQLFF